jgi:HAE1 family hydrophobic/amphiphilic exporter-1
VNALLRSITSRPVAVSMLFLALSIFGLVSLQRIPVELMPDLAYPTITVRTTHDGAAPGEMESGVARPIEESLATLDGLVGIESRSRAGAADVILNFAWGSDMPAAVQAVRESIQMVRLPNQADRPLILRYDPSLDPFMRVALAHENGDVDTLYTLREVAEGEVQRALEGIDGVAAVRVKGGLEREIMVEVRADWLAARGVRLDQVTAALQGQNINLAGGSVLEGDTEYLVRTLNEFKGIEDISSLRVAKEDGSFIPLTDLAIVREAHRERDVISHLDQAEAVEIEIFKEAGANIVETSAAVRAVLFPSSYSGLDTGLKLPDGVRLELLDDAAMFINAALSNLASTALVGGFFAVLVLYGFLRDARSTFIISLAIPVSVIVAFGPLHAFGVTLNLMSLGGLALGIGMLVDNAVVVLENIQRYRELGETRTSAAVLGTANVGAAVTASTLTTVAVFLPVSFVEGVAGVLFSDLSLAVVTSLLASLAVALVLVPMLAALTGLSISGASALFEHDESASFFKRTRAVFTGAWRTAWHPAKLLFMKHWKWVRGRWFRFPLVVWGLSRMVVTVVTVGWFAFMLRTFALFARKTVHFGAFVMRPMTSRSAWMSAGFARAYGVVERKFGKWTAIAVQRPSAVVAGALLVFIVSLSMFGTVGRELIPELHQGRFTVEVAAPVGTPLERTVALTSELEEVVSRHREVQSVYATIGADIRVDSDASLGEHTAKLRVNLIPDSDRTAQSARVMNDLRLSLQDNQEVTTRFVTPSLFSFSTPIELVLFGWDLDQLREVSESAVTRLSQVDGLTDVNSSLVRGYPELQIRYDRVRLQQFGLDPGTVATRVRDKLQGIAATRIRRVEKLVDIRVQLSKGDRSSRDSLANMNINPSLFPAIPLSAVAEVVEVVGPSEIRRVDQQRAAVVSANISDLDLGGAVSAVIDTVKDDLPEGVTAAVAGQSKEMTESLASLGGALALAIFLVYVIMASTFESLVHPFIILLSAPLALVGVGVGLFVTQTPISVVVFIGLIVLAGVVVNNAIVLVDTVNRNRMEGDGLDQAILRASAQRLRPIMVTTMTTILGLLPLTLGLGAGAEVQRPLAITVTFGLASATLLTLVVIPAMIKMVGQIPAFGQSEEVT